mmetsp:Transcript_3485/g.14098  ORF Transcript_3485/g.14098 Transcript_3485/m.14098 type:complete len:266 (-) Transcript_3485:18-815(-)
MRAVEARVELARRPRRLLPRGHLEVAHAEVGHLCAQPLHPCGRGVLLAAEQQVEDAHWRHLGDDHIGVAIAALVAATLLGPGDERPVHGAREHEVEQHAHVEHGTQSVLLRVAHDGDVDARVVKGDIHDGLRGARARALGRDELPVLAGDAGGLRRDGARRDALGRALRTHRLAHVHWDLLHLDEFLDKVLDALPERRRTANGRERHRGNAERRARAARRHDASPSLRKKKGGRRGERHGQPSALSRALGAPAARTRAPPPPPRA